MSDPSAAVQQAREAVIFTALSFDDQNYYAKWEAEMDVALTAYAEAVREDTLCDQPCYWAWLMDESPEVACDDPEERCPSCAARAQRAEVSYGDSDRRAGCDHSWDALLVESTPDGVVCRTCGACGALYR